MLICVVDTLITGEVIEAVVVTIVTIMTLMPVTTMTGHHHQVPGDMSLTLQGNTDMTKRNNHSHSVIAVVFSTVPVAQ